MKFTIDTKILELLKLVVLFSFIVCLVACKETINRKSNNNVSQKTDSALSKPTTVIETRKEPVKTKQDSILFLRKIRTDITELLEKRINIDSLIFGDCIYSLINKKESQKIVREDILKNFDLMFDQVFKESLDEKLEIENFEFIGTYDSQFKMIDNHFAATNITIAIQLNDSDYGFTRVYSFSDKNGKWIFCGLTCVG